MKNDQNLLSLGLNRTTCRTYSLLKKKELVERGRVDLLAQQEMF
jgi:hypothetical protein